MHTKGELVVIEIPKKLWTRKDLTFTEKMLLGEIYKLDTGEGCSASNEHFRKYLGLCLRYTRKVLSNLYHKSVIEIEYVNFEKRIIKIVD